LETGEKGRYLFFESSTDNITWTAVLFEVKSNTTANLIKTKYLLQLFASDTRCFISKRLGKALWSGQNPVVVLWQCYNIKKNLHQQLMEFYHKSYKSVIPFIINKMVQTIDFKK
jgi:hypothetical protein